MNGRADLDPLALLRRTNSARLPELEAWLQAELASQEPRG